MRYSDICLLLFMHASSLTPWTGSKKGWFWKDGRKRERETSRCGTWAQLHNHDMIFERMLILYFMCREWVIGYGYSCRSGQTTKKKKKRQGKALRDVQWAREILQELQVHFFLFRIALSDGRRKQKNNDVGWFCLFSTIFFSPLFFFRLSIEANDLMITWLHCYCLFSTFVLCCHIPRGFPLYPTTTTTKKRVWRKNKVSLFA